MIRFPTLLVATGVLLAGLAYATSADDAVMTEGMAQVVPPSPVPPKPPIPPEHPEPAPPRPLPDPDPPPEAV